MTDALRRLLDGVIDFAGIFPPAALSMDDAVDSYLRYRSGDEEWIQDRFICSSTRLTDLANSLTARDIGEPISVSVVGMAPSDPSEWGDSLVHDAGAMTRFMEIVGESADLEGYEIRLPGVGHLDEYLRDLRSFNQVEVYCELPPAAGFADALGAIADTEWLGAKLRTGGLEAAAFPSSEIVATFIQQCVQLEIEFKLTAGLHHPIRSYRDEVKGKMHGFLNVLSATALLEPNDLSRQEMETILECEDPAQFVFDDEGLKFGEWTADLDDIDSARDLFIGFGSCSIEEPLSDLKALGLA